MSDIAASTSTTASISVGGTLVSTIDTGGDHDWIKVQLVAGQKYTITMDSYGSSPLEDPYLTLRNASGAVITQNDDGDGNRNSRIVFTATTSGTYYIDASAWDDDQGSYQYTGEYQLSVQKYTPPPVYSYDQIADQLVNGYWGGDWHHFNVSQGGTITVNITGLTAEGQTLARAALKEWSDVIGVTFKEVTGTNADGTPAGQIVFDDNQDGAFTDTAWTNHVISTSNVNISTQWLTDYNTPATGDGPLDTYAFQTYVHEIGHALGLGHAGNYNDTADYPDDALYSNDAWSTTVMSYFSQRDSTYFANQGFTEDFALTPMSADILAMQALYGLSTTTRTGNTVYGYGSTADNPVFDASVYPHAAVTIVDSGGTDTLNYSQTSADEIVNLNPLTFSNVAGDIGNLSIAVGTVIENAKTGSGDDTIIGNDANNVLDGGAGTDTVSYEQASAGVTVNLSLTTAQATGSAGSDTLTHFENLTGSSFADVLTGRGEGVVHGGAGNDTIHGSSGGDHLYGDAGDDTFVPGAGGGDVINGGAGWDTIDFSSLKSGVVAALGNQVASSYASFTSVEEAVGSRYNDQLSGSDAANTLVGLGGDDVLRGYAGDDRLDGGTGVDKMYGGTGNDTYIVRDSTDYAYENVGEGTDTVIATISYALRANVENLSLSGTGDLTGKGNDLANVIKGTSGDNALFGYDGNDHLLGYAGSDRLDGGAGTNYLYGGVGNDTYYVENSSTYVYENAGEGTDRVYSTASLALRANIEYLFLSGSSAINGTGNDLGNSILGNDAANSLKGLGGDDKLYGGGGADAIFGNDGNDWLEGGAGKDVFTGGAGKDNFVFRDGDFGGATSAPADRITDFNSGEDHIRLNYADANVLVSGDQAFAFIGTAEFHDRAGELRYEISGNYTFVSGDTNGDGIADFMIRLDGSHALVSNDFIL